MTSSKTAVGTPTGRHWLLKSEPETYSFDQLLEDGRTNWNDVRNFQARNYLREAQVGELALIYHSGGEKAVVGIAKVVKAAYPDPDSDPNAKNRGDWFQIDIAPVRKLKAPVTLAQIKGNRVLESLPLIRQSRLSVMPITAKHFEAILALSEKAAAL